jgi:hypothetical protein
MPRGGPRRPAKASEALAAVAGLGDEAAVGAEATTRPARAARKPVGGHHARWPSPPSRDTARGPCRLNGDVALDF